jgi:hypothetical protein
LSADPSAGIIRQSSMSGGKRAKERNSNSF